MTKMKNEFEIDAFKKRILETARACCRTYLDQRELLRGGPWCHCHMVGVPVEQHNMGLAKDRPSFSAGMPAVDKIPSVCRRLI
jgi:hypothetical protein